jgi:hypothetical protein
MMLLRPFFSFFGSKWRIARRYPAPIGGTILEPFAGSAGYALRYPSLSVTLYEIDPKIASIWQYLIKVKESEILSLPLMMEDITSLPICEDAKTLIGFWLNKGVAQPCKVPSAWMRRPEYASQFWGESIRRRIATQVEHIRHWKVLNLSYCFAPDIRATWFIDPPYKIAGRHYRFNSVDYSRLSEWCRSRTGRVIVCENEGADWLPFNPLIRAKAMSKVGGRNHSMEVMWINEQ